MQWPFLSYCNSLKERNNKLYGFINSLDAVEEMFSNPEDREYPE